MLWSASVNRATTAVKDESWTGDDDWSQLMAIKLQVITCTIFKLARGG